MARLVVVVVVVVDVVVVVFADVVYDLNENEPSQSECWFVVAHHFLSGLHNNLGRRIIENIQKNVEIPENHDYVNTFTYLKNCISRNLKALADHHCL